MMGAHPNGDYSHQQQQQDETMRLSAPPPRVDERQNRSAANLPRFSQNNKPVALQPRSTQ
ncbi:hypothetical protein E2C01_091740 [Portunus trituberculatus]|uniref:Uncharacterized protein n=1 Tax=Portunus trituberculatus TaxID=210409 RepID=A0A5B7JTR5_PORTR|nr:hypothetical protein [Portunus trituberculatus]